MPKEPEHEPLVDLSTFELSPVTASTAHPPEAESDPPGAGAALAPGAEAMAEPTPTQPLPTLPAARRPARRWVIGGAVALLCLAVVAVGLVISLNGQDRALWAESGPEGADAGEHTVTAPIAGRQQAELHLVSGTGVVTVGVADLGDRAYEVSTPPDADAVPEIVERNDRIEVHLAPTGRAGPSSVEVTLSNEIRWTTLRFSGGANEQVVDLSGGMVGEVDFSAGAARIELTLPVPDGTVPIRVGAGAGVLVVNAPAEAPVRATLSSGAGQVVIDGEAHAGVAPEAEFAPDGWEDAEDRYELASAGLGELLLTHAGPG